MLSSPSSHSALYQRLNHEPQTSRTPNLATTDPVGYVAAVNGNTTEVRFTRGMALVSLAFKPRW
jgi:hypothetical protein